MGEFLAGDDLSQKIREVVSGANARCAVAFWGKDAVKELFGTEVLERDDVHVVCDLSMGGTNPATLRALGAPNNSKIKYHDGLHAKVFLSENGAVVGSANASNNGIGFMGGNAKLLEAGTYHPRGSDAWRTINGWFTDLKKNDSTPVDSLALNAAQLAWNRRRSAVGPRAEAGAQNFLDYDPEIDGLIYVLWYEDVGDIRGLSDAAFEAVDPQNNNNWIDVSPEDIDFRQSWVCCFELNQNGFAHNNTDPIFFFADSLIEGGAPNSEGYENVLAQTPRSIRPNSPFNFQDRRLLSAFRAVINDPEGPYAPLRGDIDAGDQPWLARDHVELMHRFWHDVQAEYRRLQAEA